MNPSEMPYKANLANVSSSQLDRKAHSPPAVREGRDGLQVRFNGKPILWCGVAVAVGVASQSLPREAEKVRLPVVHAPVIHAPQIRVPSISIPSVKAPDMHTSSLVESFRGNGFMLVMALIVIAVFVMATKGQGVEPQRRENAPPAPPKPQPCTCNDRNEHIAFDFKRKVSCPCCG